MPYHILDHTADTGIEATAATLTDLIQELATGMFGLISNVDPSSAERWVRLNVESPTLEDLVVDTLSQLLFQSEVEDLVFCDFRVVMKEEAPAVILEAGGVPVGSVMTSGPPIKAVTYHRLVVEERDGGWYGRVYFDV